MLGNYHVLIYDSGHYRWMVITSVIYLALDFTVGNLYSCIPYLLDPHICIGGLELNDISCMANIFDTTRLSPHSSSSIVLL